MIRQSDFRAFNVKFHRNGCGGQGFYVCRFLFRQGREWVPMVATVFDSPGFVAVLSADLNERYRGDDFEPALLDAIAAVEKAQSETIYDRETSLLAFQ